MNIVISTNVEAEIGSGKIYMDAEGIWENEREAEMSEVISFIRSRKLKILKAKKRKRTRKCDTSRGAGRKTSKKLTASSSL